MPLPLLLYAGVVNSPPTTLTSAITASDTTIPVADISVFTVPGPATIGVGVNAETVFILSISGSALTVTRAFQGVAQAWPANEFMARDYTEYDHRAFIEGITHNNNVAEAAQTAASTAVQSATLGGTPVTKTGTSLAFPAYPVVYNWALQPTKPAYTPAEIGLADFAGLTPATLPVSIATQAALNSKSDVYMYLPTPYTLEQANWTQPGGTGDWVYTIIEGTPKFFSAGRRVDITYLTQDVAELTGGLQIVYESNETGTLTLSCANQPEGDIQIALGSVQYRAEVLG